MTETPPILPTLPMQLMLAMGCWLSSPFALQCARSAWPLLNNSSKNQPNPSLQQAVAEEAKNRATNLLSGILRYVETPYQRDVAEPPCIWQCGNARVLDYGLNVPSSADRPIVLFVPSLINRYYILDLEKERSMLRFLATQGVYPLVLDWGSPSEFEQDFGVGDYITEILNPAIDFITNAAGSRIVLAGYCMGGNLTLAAAKLKRAKVAALALLATPWDFSCKEFAPFMVDTHWQKTIADVIAGQKTLPAEAIQSLFYLTDPWVFEQKFRRFANLQPDSRAARDFVALERWVNDGVPMTAPVAKDCLIGWAQKNVLMNGQWQVAGKTIDPHSVKLPTFIAMPDNDHVVPRDCASPLAKAMPHANIIYPGAGHVGMIVGSHSQRELWQPLVNWIRAFSI